MCACVLLVSSCCIIVDCFIVQVEIITAIGFLKEAPHANTHGFNIYHRNRLILVIFFSYIVKQVIYKINSLTFSLTSYIVKSVANSWVVNCTNYTVLAKLTMYFCYTYIYFATPIEPIVILSKALLLLPSICSLDILNYVCQMSWDGFLFANLWRMNETIIWYVIYITFINWIPELI